MCEVSYENLNFIQSNELNIFYSFKKITSSDDKNYRDGAVSQIDKLSFSKSSVIDEHTNGNTKRHN